MRAAGRRGTRAKEASERMTRRSVDDKVGRFVFWHEKETQSGSRDESKLTDVVYEYEKREDTSIRHDESTQGYSQSQENSQRDTIADSSIHQDESTQRYDKIYEQIFGPDSPRHIGDTGTSQDTSSATYETTSFGAAPSDTLNAMSMEETIYEEVAKEEDEMYHVGCLDSLFLPSKKADNGFLMNPIQCERVGPNKSECRISLALNYPSAVLESLPSPKYLQSALQGIRCTSKPTEQKVKSASACRTCNSEDDRSIGIDDYPMPDYADPSGTPHRSLFISPSESSSSEGDGDSAHTDVDLESILEEGEADQSRDNEQEGATEPEFFDRERYYDNEEDDREHIVNLNSFIPFDAPSRGKSSCSRSGGRSRRSRLTSSHSSKPPSSLSSVLNVTHGKPVSGKGVATESSSSRGSKGRNSGPRRQGDAPKCNTGDELMGRVTPEQYAAKTRPPKSASSSGTHASDETDGSTPRLTPTPLQARRASQVGNPVNSPDRRLVSLEAQHTDSAAPVVTSKSSIRRPHSPRQNIAPSFDEDPYPSFDEQSKPSGPHIDDGDELMGRQKFLTIVPSSQAQCNVGSVKPLNLSTTGTLVTLMGNSPSKVPSGSTSQYPRRANKRIDVMDQPASRDPYDASTVDTSINGAHQVPVLIHYMEARAASSLDETDLESSHPDAIAAFNNANDVARVQSVIEQKPFESTPKAKDRITAVSRKRSNEEQKARCNTEYERSQRENLTIPGYGIGRREPKNSSSKDTERSFAVDVGPSERKYASSKNTHESSDSGLNASERRRSRLRRTEAFSRFNEEPDDSSPLRHYEMPRTSLELLLDSEKPATWKDFLCSPPRTLRGDVKDSSCPSDEVLAVTVSRGNIREQELQDFNEDDPLVLSRTVPHSGTTDSVPHIETPTDSAIWATVDRLLGHGWQLDQEDHAMAPVEETTAEPEASRDLSDVYPAVVELAEKFLLQEAARLISATLQLLPIPEDLEFTVPPLKSTQVLIELLDDAKLDSCSAKNNSETSNNIVGSDNVESRLACRDGMAPLEGGLQFANLDELLYPGGTQNVDTVDFVKIIDKFASAHPYCLPASFEFIFANPNGETDTKEDKESEGQNSQGNEAFELDFALLQALLDEIPPLLRSGESFQCRHMYVLAWVYTRMMSTAVTWWETWNTPWTKPRDKDEDDLYEG
jgi:hypothetical protein